jgi:hypothetical protein
MAFFLAGTRGKILGRKVSYAPGGDARRVLLVATWAWLPGHLQQIAVP